MQNQFLSNIFISLVLIFGVTGQTAYANVLNLDNFSHYQRVSDDGEVLGLTSNTVSPLTGTDLLNASRAFMGEATASNSGSEITIKSNGGFLKISNGPASAGQASILWNFDPVDFTKFGTGLLLEVVMVDLNVNVEMVVNGNASSGSKTFTGEDDFLVKFSDFSNNAAFSSVNSLRLNFSGPLAWDGKFKLLMDAAVLNPVPTVASVPVPAAYLLMGSALLGLVGISRKKP